ncbi:MAG: patatin family protein [Clostridia bacterium]|nr:patatin family protein [Clostridia bacterium]
MENGMTKEGLILEGGAMRGMFTAGVLDVLMEHGITLDGAVGVSAGAAFGCNFKSGQIGRTIRYNMRFCNDKRYCSLRSLLRTGNLFNADFCYRIVPELLDLFDAKAFAENPMEFYVVATDIEMGRAVYKRMRKVEGKDYEWFRASASLPVLAKPVEIDGHKYLDGGITDSIPLRFFESIGYERNLVILTRPADYRKKKSGGGGLMRLALGKYPKTLEALHRRHEDYNRTLDYIAKREAEGAVLVIQPEQTLVIDRLERDPEKLKAVYEVGRKICEKNLTRIRDFLR